MKKCNFKNDGSSQLRLHVVVSKTGKYNYQDGKDKKIISEQWFDTVYPTVEDYGCVCLNKKWNLIDSNGNYLFDQWFDDIRSYFFEDYVPVKLNDKWNWVDREGKYFSEQWYDLVDRFHQGAAVVKLDGKWNHIDKEGNFLHEWFSGPICCANNGIFTVTDLEDGSFSIHKIDGTPVTKEWFDSIPCAPDELTPVKKNGKWNYIDKEGKYISEQWFDEAGSFLDKFAKVRLNDKWNLIDKNGKLLNERWFDDISPLFIGKYVDTKIDGKDVYVNRDGKIFIEKPSDYDE